MGATASTFSEDDLLKEARAFQREAPDKFELVLRLMLKAKAESHGVPLQQTISPQKISSYIFDPALGSAAISEEISAEITLLRLDPVGYTKYLRMHMQRFVTHNAFALGDENIRFMTHEGKTAVQEAIDVLQNTKPLGSMQANSLLEKAAMDHVNDLSTHPGLSGHVGSDGSQSSDRVSRYGQYEVVCGENIDYGMNSAREIIIHLLIDDGVPSRGHRKNLLEPRFQMVGASFGFHHEFRCCCVMDFAGGMKSYDDLVLHDTVLACESGQNLPETAIKIIHSFSSGEEATQLIAMCLERLGTGQSVSFNYKYTSKTCELNIGGREILTYTWS